MYDILIKNGTIVDGSGKPGFLADVAIKDDKISAIGELHDEKAQKIIDAEGRFVCPGFIDVNNHSDTFWRIFFDPDLESLVRQGITTIVGGSCGSSLAPLATGQTIESIQKWTDLNKINVNWLTLKEFFSILSQKKLAVNFSMLVGHATLRRGILKDEMRSPNPKELRFMERMLETAFRQGALGISTGLVYTHARMATKEELMGIAKLVKKYKGVYATHIRNEADELVESIEDSIEIAKKTGVKMHISHLKAVGRSNWGKMERVLGLISKASQSGMNLSFDVYPYTNTGSVLYTLLPSWVSEGGKKMMLSRLKDKAVRAKVIEEMRDSKFEYDKVEIASSSMDKTLPHRSITRIASSQGKTVEDAVIDILLASEGRVITSMEVLNEDNIRAAIKHPLAIIATNGAGYGITHFRTGEQIHPRSFGTYPKVLEKYVFKEKIISLEEAIRKMTAAPAEKFGIKKRGFIKKGFFADILVFDESRISTLSTKDNPYHYAKGIDYSLVGGSLVMEKGEYTGKRNGEIVKR